MSGLVLVSEATLDWDVAGVIGKCGLCWSRADASSAADGREEQEFNRWGAAVPNCP